MGVKTLKTLADAFRLAHHSLLKLIRYEGLVHNEDRIIAEINEIADSTSNIKLNNWPKMSDSKQKNKNTKNYTFWGNCWKCGKFGYSVKECQSNSNMANQDWAYKGQTHILTAEPIRYSIPISPARSPVLTQHITADFQLSWETWKKLSSQMTEMAEADKLLKKAIRNTYQKVNSIPNPPLRKLLTLQNLQESRQNRQIYRQIEYGQQRLLTRPPKI